MQDKKIGFFYKLRKSLVGVWNFYVEGFQSMTLGKILWLIILIKLFVMFCILRPFFFPRFLNEDRLGESKDEYVAGELIDRGVNNEREFIIDTNK